MRRFRPQFRAEDAGSSQPAEEILTDAPGCQTGRGFRASRPRFRRSPPPPQPPARSAAPGAAPIPQPEPTDYRLRINARLVDVNVVALDKKGNPITGLTQDDFEVYDNGVKQVVGSFGRADAPEPAPATAPAPASAAETAPPQPAFSNQHPSLNRSRETEIRWSS